jgi:ATP-dependent Clp protease ATP-binding subunit ClpA
MATLHVRNVPDPVYDALRESAEANGRSIGSEAITLIQQGLGTPASRAPWRRRGRTSGTGFLSHFSEAGRGIVVLAQQEARNAGYAHVGPEHLLIGLLRRPLSAGGRALVQCGLTLDDARAALARLAPPMSPPPGGQLPFAPKAKEVLELSLREALRLKHTFIGTEHILLGLTRVEESVATAILHEAQVDVAELRACAQRPSFEMLPLPRADEFRVVDLQGEDAAWERQLNDVAAEGYELVQLVQQRAIFRRR